MEVPESLLMAIYPWSVLFAEKTIRERRNPIPVSAKLDSISVAAAGIATCRQLLTYGLFYSRSTLAVRSNVQRIRPGFRPLSRLGV
jgi:hypothetical protein